MLQMLRNVLVTLCMRLNISFPRPYPNTQRTLLGVCLVTLLCCGILCLSYIALLAGQSVWHFGTQTLVYIEGYIERHSSFIEFSDIPIEDPAALALAHIKMQESIEYTRLYEIAASYPFRERLYLEEVPYAEHESNLNTTGKQIDHALIQAFTHLGITNAQLFVFAVEQRQHKQNPYLFQRLQIHTDQDIAAILKILEESLAAGTSGTQISLHNNHVLLVSSGGVTSHALYIVPRNTPFVMPPPKGAPRLSIVMDDLGENVRVAKRLLRFQIPITFSIWPDSTNARQIATMAHKAGHEVFIHQPMEPLRYPAVKPGINPLLINMDKKTIKETLEANMAKVPFSVGLNNHMGSRFTINSDSSAIVIDFLSEKAYMILDSLTHPRSVLGKTAYSKGVSAMERTLFLDDTQDSASALKNLYRAERIARNTGFAIVIGHPKASTLKALETWIAKRDKTVNIVPLRYQKPFKP